ncbi:MAG TPA: aldo/keto reductase [Spongiibacteraceae bacterium]|nr:aldo/keto reductase [Spongiibacteraceae bacterium]
MVATAIEGGVNFIDTADGYANGQSELCVGRALKDLNIERSDIVICSKGGMRMRPGPNGDGASRAYLMQACENSLKRLGTDYIDLYMVHVFDPVTPLEETLRALDDLQRAGKVRYVGCSNFAGWELMKALDISKYEGLARFEVVESHWSIATRDMERDIVPLARSEGIGIMAWGALLGGVLTGKYRRDGSSDQAGRRGGAIPAGLNRDKIHDIVDTMRDIADAHGVTPAEIALAFLLRENVTSSVIFGSTKPEQVQANLKASGLALSSDEIERLEAISAPTWDYFTQGLLRMRAARQLPG